MKTIIWIVLGIIFAILIAFLLVWGVVHLGWMAFGYDYTYIQVIFITIALIVVSNFFKK